MSWISKHTPEQKAQIWKIIMTGREKYFSELYTKYKNKLFADLFMFESTGGPCKTCGVRWLEKTFDNPSLAGRYFVPNCDCFVTCPICDTPLYDLQFQEAKLTRCDNCHFKLHNPVTKTKRYGREFKSLYDTSSEYRKHQIRIERYDTRKDK